MLKLKSVKHNRIQPEKIAGLPHHKVGRVLEDSFACSGHNVDHYGAGPDLPEFGVEVKSRCATSSSPHSVTSMTTDYIINTPYIDSRAKEKCIAQHRFVYDDCGNTIQDRTYNFSFNEVQARLEYAYEKGRAEIAALPKNSSVNNTKVHGIGYFQREAKGVEQWKFRITDSGMKRIEQLSRQLPQFDKFFDIQ